MINLYQLHINLRLKRVQQLRENEELLERLEERREKLNKLKLEKLEKIEKMKCFFKNRLDEREADSCDMCDKVLGKF